MNKYVTIIDTGGTLDVEEFEDLNSARTHAEEIAGINTDTTVCVYQRITRFSANVTVNEDEG